MQAETLITSLLPLIRAEKNANQTTSNQVEPIHKMLATLMTLSADDSKIIELVIQRYINEVPKFQQEYVLSDINRVYQGKTNYDIALTDICRRFGQRTRGIAKKILDGILLEFAVPAKVE